MARLLRWIGAAIVVVVGLRVLFFLTGLLFRLLDLLILVALVVAVYAIFERSGGRRAP